MSGCVGGVGQVGLGDRGRGGGRNSYADMPMSRVVPL